MCDSGGELKGDEVAPGVTLRVRQPNRGLVPISLLNSNSEVMIRIPLAPPPLKGLTHYSSIV